MVYEETKYERDDAGGMTKPNERHTSTTRHGNLRRKKNLNLGRLRDMFGCICFSPVSNHVRVSHIYGTNAMLDQNSDRAV